MARSSSVVSVSDRRLGVMVLALVAALVAALITLSPTPAQAAPYPTKMAALGDSITRGFNACGWYVDCPSRSWATGTDSNVNSHYQRLRASEPGLEGNNANNAKTGATSYDLVRQASQAVATNPDYIAILIGANDACAGTEAGMTSVDAYRTNIRSGLATIAANAPNAHVFVASVPDIKRLWETGKGSWSARLAWNTFNICQSMLASPSSTATADNERRDRVRQRVVDYNAVLAEECATYGQLCTFDGNATFNTRFELSHVSGWDYFHPNTAGQRLLAEVTYRAGFTWGAPVNV